VSITEVTDDEFALLMIMAQGQSVAAIGKWEKPLDALVERGLARRLDKFNNIITTEGRKACDTRESADTAALKSLLPQIASAQDASRGHIEAAAQHLAQAARITAPMTGDGPETAMLNWNLEVLKRARELLRE
jgi:hypothetical protein